VLSAALLERWPRVCRVKITFTELPTNRFVYTTKKSMKCVVNCIPLRIRVRSRNTQPHLNQKHPIIKLAISKTRGVVNCIPLRIRVRSRNTQPHLHQEHLLIEMAISKNRGSPFYMRFRGILELYRETHTHTHTHTRILAVAPFRLFYFCLSNL